MLSHIIAYDGGQAVTFLNYGVNTMINLKTDSNHLNNLIAQITQEGERPHFSAEDIKDVAGDISQLVATVEQLTEELERVRLERAELQSLVMNTGAPLIKFLWPVIESRLEQDPTILDIQRRLRSVEDDKEWDEEAIRNEVRDMINDGDIIVTIDTV